MRESGISPAEGGDAGGTAPDRFRQTIRRRPPAAPTGQTTNRGRPLGSGYGDAVHNGGIPEIEEALGAPDFQDHMHEVFAELRSRAPVYWSPSLNYWLVTRFDLVEEVLRNPADYSSQGAEEAYIRRLPTEVTREPADPSPPLPASRPHPLRRRQAHRAATHREPVVHARGTGPAGRRHPPGGRRTAQARPACR